MSGKKQIIFKDGCFDGLRFNESSSNEFSAPELLILGLKRLGFENSDLEFFFARSEKMSGSNDLIWEINAPNSHKTLEFFNLDELPEFKNEIEARNVRFETDLRSFYASVKPITTEDKKIFEALSRILENFSERKLYAGFDSQKQNYFPVVIGWGGKFSRNISRSGELIGGQAQKRDNKEPIPDSQPNSLENNIPAASDGGFIHSFYWLIWVIIFLLALLIIAKLTPSCGLRGFINTCQVEQKTSSEIYNLESYLQKLTRQSLVKHNVCLQSKKMVKNILEKTPTKKDLDIKTRLDREDADISEVSVSLAWDTKEDLDLSVTCPNDKTVSHQKKLLTENSCGTLDVDANFKVNILDDPVEHIILKQFYGTYKISVKSMTNARSNKSEIPTSFKIEVNNSGLVSRFDGSISPGETKSFSFDRQP